MTPAQDILLKLIRISLGGETDFAFPNTSVNDWRKMIEMSFVHAMSSVCVDGVQKCIENNPDIAKLFSLEEMEDAKYEWFGCLFSDEDQWDMQWSSACRMSEIFHNAGLKTYILKGFSIAEMYPNPKHRIFCDLDCYLLDANGGEAYEKGNQLIEQKGLRVNRSYYKNSVYNFLGLMVENHCFISPVRGYRNRKTYEKYLRSILDDGSTPLTGSRMIVPSPLFNLLFTTSHAMYHFLFEEGLSIRHLCDWGMMMKHYSSSDSQLWRQYVEKCKEFGLFKFACSFSRCAATVSGIELPFACPENTSADGSMLDLILNMKEYDSKHLGTWGQRAQNVFGIIRSGWKFKFYSETSMPAAIMEVVTAFIFERRPRL